MKLLVTDGGFGLGPRIVLNPATGLPYVYMTEAQAKKGAEKRPGTVPRARLRHGKVISWLLVVPEEKV